LPRRVERGIPPPYQTKKRPNGKGQAARDPRSPGHREAAARLAGETCQSIQRKLDAGGEAEGLQLLRMEGLYLAGRLAEALAAGQGILRRNPASLPALGRLGVIHADLGQAPEARAVMARLARLPRKDQLGNLSLLRARIASRLGEKDLALTLLREATAEGQPIGHVRHRDVAFEGLQGYTPFEAYLRPKP